MTSRARSSMVEQRTHNPSVAGSSPAGPIICQYCGERATLITGAEVYPHRPDLHGKKFWACRRCDARVGCHPGTEKPLGDLANAETRLMRLRAHDAFDRLWRSGRVDRSTAYRWLSAHMGVRSAHIGRMNVEQCRKVIRLCSEIPS